MVTPEGFQAIQELKGRGVRKRKVGGRASIEGDPLAGGTDLAVDAA